MLSPRTTGGISTTSHTFYTKTEALLDSQLTCLSVNEESVAWALPTSVFQTSRSTYHSHGNFERKSSVIITAVRSMPKQSTVSEGLYMVLHSNRFVINYYTFSMGRHAKQSIIRTVWSVATSNALIDTPLRKLLLPHARRLPVMSFPVEWPTCMDVVNRILHYTLVSECAGGTPLRYRHN